MIARQTVRVTIEGIARDVGPGEAEAEGFGLDVTGRGSAILGTRAGPRRILWAARSARAGPDHGAPLRVELVVDGWRFEATVEPAARAALLERARRGAATAHGHRPLALRAPIPGRIGAVRVVEGQDVEEGEMLLTLEAMKMENVVRAPRAGTIARVAVGTGETVELGDTLVELA